MSYAGGAPLQWRDLRLPPLICRPERSEGPRRTTNDSVAAARSFAALRLTIPVVPSAAPALRSSEGKDLGEQPTSLLPARQEKISPLEWRAPSEALSAASP